MYSGVSWLLLVRNLSRHQMISITLVRHVGKVHFQSDYDISGHDKASFFSGNWIYMGGVLYVIVKDFCQVPYFLWHDFLK